MKTGEKKRSSSPKCHDIRCQSTKITKIPLANTNLGLDLHSSSPEPVNFFGSQSSLGRHSPEMHPRGAGPESNLIARVKTPNIGFTNIYIINLGIKGGGGYSQLVNYQSLLSNIFPLATQSFFFIKYRRNRLLRVSFIE